MPTPPTDPEIASYRSQYQDIGQDVERLLASLSDDQINWRPSAERWSVAQSIDHLVTTWRQYHPIIGQVIAAGRERGAVGGGPFRRGILLGWLIRQMEPPPRRRFRAPGPFAASSEATTGSELAARYRAANDECRACIAAADGLDLRRLRLTSPASRLLRMNLAEAIALLAAHERRHLWQARETTWMPGFPGRA